MRTNNARVKNVIVSVYFTLIVMAILMATLFSAFIHLTPNPTIAIFIVIFVFVVLFLIIHRVSRYFEYDSDGIKVVVINKGLLLSDYFNYREHKLEFKKENLINYKFQNYIIYKRLILQIKNSNGTIRKETFNITLIGKRKRRYIRQSLSKMVKNNIKTTNN